MRRRFALCRRVASLPPSPSVDGARAHVALRLLSACFFIRPARGSERRGSGDVDGDGDDGGGDDAAAPSPL